MKKGYTLIELLITISVLSVLSTLSFSSFSLYISKTELTIFAYSLRTVIKSTRVKTQMTERIHWLTFKNDSCLVYRDNGDGTLEDNDIKLKSLSLVIPNRIKLSFTNEKCEKHGLKFSYEKMWWPAGSINISTNNNISNSFKLTFPVGTQKCNFYELVGDSTIKR